MKLTNKAGLPEPFYNAQLKCEKSYRDGRGATQRSLTQLIADPLSVRLKELYDDKIEVDLMDRLHILRGNMIHKILEESAGKIDIAELRVFADICGWTISGQADHLAVDCKDGVLTDYKNTGWYSLKNGPKREWIWQLNCLAYLLRLNGYKVDRMQNCCWFYDWKESEAKKAWECDRWYPEAPIMNVEIPVYSDKKILKYLKTRVKMHQEACKTDDPRDIPMCEDTWEGRRCKRYCEVKKFCPYMKKKKKSKKYV